MNLQIVVFHNLFINFLQYTKSSIKTLGSKLYLLTVTNIYYFKYTVGKVTVQKYSTLKSFRKKKI